VDLPIIGTPVTVSVYGKGHIVENGRHLFITSGVGTSGMPVRFRVPPEIAILHLTPST
jgi:predicted MPP superfamily phosphohydrolase